MGYLLCKCLGMPTGLGECHTLHTVWLFMDFCLPLSQDCSYSRFGGGLHEAKVLACMVLYTGRCLFRTGRQHISLCEAEHVIGSSCELFIAHK